MIVPVLILTLGLAALILLTFAGCLRGDALQPGPSRRIGLHPADLLIGLGLMILGPALIAEILSPSPSPDAATKADVDILTYASNVLLAQLMGQGVPVLYLLVRAGMRPDGLRLIGFIPTRPWRDLRWGVIGFLAATPIVMAVIHAAVLIGELFGQQAPTLAHPMLQKLVTSDSPAGTALIIVSAVLVAPILEESIFRGLIQSVMVEALGEARRWAVVLIAALVFAMMHADLVSWENWQTLPGLFVLGVALGWLYERAGSLWPNIVLHVLFNALNILLALGSTMQQSA